MNWNRISLFKLPNRHKRFDYVPRYYNPEKEALQRKIDQAKIEANQGGELQSPREIQFRSQIESKWGNSEYKASSMLSNIRLIVILGILLVVFYYVFVALDNMGIFLDENMDKLK